MAQYRQHPPAVPASRRTAVRLSAGVNAYIAREQRMGDPFMVAYPVRMDSVVLGLVGYRSEVLLSAKCPEAQHMVLAGQDILVAVWDEEMGLHELWTHTAEPDNPLGGMMRLVNPVYGMTNDDDQDARFLLDCVTEAPAPQSDRFGSLNVRFIDGDGRRQRTRVQGSTFIVPTKVTSRPRTLGYWNALALAMAKESEDMFLRTLERWNLALEAVEAGVELTRMSSTTAGADPALMQHAPDWTLERALQNGDLAEIRAYHEMASVALKTSRRAFDGATRVYSNMIHE